MILHTRYVSSKILEKKRRSGLLSRVLGKTKAGSKTPELETIGAVGLGGTGRVPLFNLLLVEGGLFGGLALGGPSEQKGV